MAIELDELAGADGGDESQRLAKHWLAQLETITDEPENKRWQKRGDDIQKRYRDERNRIDEEGQRRYNSLWANVQILQPALYGKCPLPIAERRFKDPDPTGRHAASILERGLRNEIEINGFDEAINAALLDYLLPGRGSCWVRYEPEIEEGISLPPEPQQDMRDAQGRIDEKGDETEVETDEERSDGEEPESASGGEESEAELPDQREEEIEKLRSTGDRIIRESCPVDYIPWSDFFTLPVKARIWKEVTEVAKRVWMSRDQLCRRFGNDIGKKIPLERDDRGQRSASASAFTTDGDKAQVYEIWSRTYKKVYWVAKGYQYLCDCKDDPLKLEHFFPVPKPLYANPTNNTLFPVPDYIQYQDQAIQIDELTQRIAMLAKACKMAGLYNAAAKEIQRMFDESVENELIPVDDWAAFAEKGGVEGNISLLPLKEIIGILNELMMIKEKQIVEMDRLTGITDIMRGTTDARETLGGQRLKTNSSGTRLQKRQDEVARFAREVVRIMADIMAQHFSPQSLIEASGALCEQGLGPDEMPTLMNFQPGGLQPPAPPQLPPPAMGGPAGPVAPQAGPPGLPAGGPPPQPGIPPVSGAPPAPMGQNVVPLRPPPPGGPPPMGGMPPMGGSPPMQPQVPPELMAKFKAIERIVKAIGLIRNERLRGFRVDIEVDSTIYGDSEQEKQDRTQFLAAVTKFFESSMALGAQMPEIVPLMAKLLGFGVRGFRVGRDLETAIEEFSEEAVVIAKRKAEQMATQQNPEQMKMMADARKADALAKQAEASTQTQQQQAAADIKTEQIKAQNEAQQAAAEVERQKIENQGEMLKSAADMKAKEMDMEMKRIELEIKKLEMQVQLAKAQMELRQSDQETKSKLVEHAVNIHQQAEDHEFQKESHDQQMEQQEQLQKHQKKMQEIQAKKAAATAKAQAARGKE